MYSPNCTNTEPLNPRVGSMLYVFDTKEQALKQRKEQGADKGNPTARSTKNAKKQDGAEKNSKKKFFLENKNKKDLSDQNSGRVYE